MTGPTVRETTAADAADVQRIARVSWHAAYDDVLGEETVEQKVDSWFDPENVVADVNRTQRPFYVAERDGTVCGFAIAVPDDERERTYHLYRIYVRPDDWGEGVGTRLLDRIENELRGRRVDRLRLSVFARNDSAIGFYESRGFERVEKRRGEAFDLCRYVYAKDL